MRAERRRGFTLLEMVVAVAVLAVVVSLALPSLLAATPQERLRRATADLVSNLRWARSMAVGGQASGLPAGLQVAQVEVSFNPAADNYSISVVDNNGVLTLVRTVDLLKYQSGAVRLDLSAAVPPLLRFERNGGANAIAQVTLAETTTGQSRLVSITRAGLARAE